MSDVIDHVSSAENRRICRLVADAVRKGILERPSYCSWCGDDTKRIVGHHPDYARPLMVVWICDPCHIAHHREYARERRMFMFERSPQYL